MYKSLFICKKYKIKQVYKRRSWKEFSLYVSNLQGGIF